MPSKILFIPGIVENIVGGAEYQMKLLAEKLYNLDFEIYGILFSENSSDLAKNKYIKKNFYYKLTKSKIVFSNKVYNYIKTIRPDIIIQRANQPFLGIASYYCKKNNCKIIWHIASELDVIPFKFEFKKRIIFNYIDKKFLEYGIKNSTYIIGQAKYQDQLLRKHYGRRCDIIIPNFHPKPENKIEKRLPIKVVWVANFKQWKQPELFIKLAENLETKNIEFIMVGKKSAGRWQKRIDDMIKKSNKICYRGELSLNEVNLFLSSAHIFVNTSFAQEGFPNTFIQAWMREVPVVSLNVDPDDVIKRNKLGFHSGSFEQMVKDVRFLVERPEVREEMGKRAKKYAIREHDIEKIVPKYVNLFERLITKE